MFRKPYRKPFFLLLAAAIALRVFSLYPSNVESLYAQGAYPPLARFMRMATSWLPISLGDILYICAGAWLIWSVWDIVRKLIRKRAGDINPWKTATIFLAIYLYFNISWGLNYNRLGISYQLKLEVTEPEGSQLNDLCSALLEKTNRYAGRGGRIRPEGREAIHEGAIQSYRSLAKEYPFLQYRSPALKASVFGVMGNYLGYTGYYNPFTGEAQVNEAVPGFLHPFVTCHEIAHQLGYARENEANFVGFLAARQSPDSLFRYSAYLDMFLYANAQLYRLDSAAARANLRQLAPEAQRDLAELRAFRIRYQNPLEIWVDRFYDQFLRLNQQPAGTKTYGRVVLWLLAEYRKRGEI